MEFVDDPLFWLLWLATAGVCLGVVAGAIINPRKLLEGRLYVVMMWAYFYVFLAYHAALKLSSIIPRWCLDLGQGVALACLVFFVFGWSRGGRLTPTPRPGTLVPLYSARRLWMSGILLIAAGAIGYRAFVNVGRTQYEGTTAYWYLIFHLIYPGLGLCLIARTRMKAMAAPWRDGIVALGVLYGLWPQLVTARRGPLFPAAILVLVMGPLVARREPSRWRVLGGLVGTGALMLLFVTVRPWVYGRAGESVGEAWSSALTTVTATDVVVTRAGRQTDNEYVYHCGMIGTVVEREAYQYGTGYLPLLTHWIPRQLWPSKPVLGRGWFPDAESQMPFVVGWSMSAGAAAGGAAEVFNQFGFASPLAWLFFGWIMARQGRRASEVGDPRAQLAYLGGVCASHWLVSQGVAAAFVPAVIYQLVPLLFLRFARTGYQQVPVERGATVGAQG